MQALIHWLNGKKTAIASLYWTATELILPVWFANGVPEPYDKIITTVGVVLTAIGLGHKAVKAVKHA